MLAECSLMSFVFNFEMHAAENGKGETLTQFVDHSLACFLARGHWTLLVHGGFGAQSTHDVPE